MMRNLLIFILLASVCYAADDCAGCINSGKHWCTTTNTCDSAACSPKITKALNCPKLPDPQYAYNDTEARVKWLPLFGASGFFLSKSKTLVQNCLTKNIPSMVVYSVVDVNCTTPGRGRESNCFMYTSYDPTMKIIVMSFRGTDSPIQLFEEFEDYGHQKRQFFDVGYIFDYFYDGFMFLWNGGLGNDIRNLKYLYPDYELWVTGHSLGGALASVAASHVVKIGLFDPLKVRLLTIGQPRTGDYAYAQWHDNTFPYSYRVVHHRDVVAHIPPQIGPNGDEMWHHRTEIWYNNDMSLGQPYNVCAEADGLYCSATQLDTSAEDHLIYYNVDMAIWGMRGCPKIYT